MAITSDICYVFTDISGKMKIIDMQKTSLVPLITEYM